MKYSSCIAIIGVSLLAVAAAMPAAAETINDALVQTYQTNPTIRADRARQRVTDESVPQALSGWRPTVTASAQAGQETLDSNIGRRTTINPSDVAIQLSQPIFRGFRTVNSTGAAEATVRAGQQALSATEQAVLFDAASAYSNVVRDRASLERRSKDVAANEEQLRTAEARFKVGEITRTDVAQARAALSQSQTTLSIAQANLQTSLANYERVVGSAPGTLAAPTLPRNLPASLEAAVALGSKLSPEVLSAIAGEEAARFQIGVARSGLLPQASVNATAIRSHDPSVTVSRSTTESVVAQVTVPIYEGGLVYSEVRQAKQQASQRRIQIIESQRAVRNAITAAWNSLTAARSAIQSTGEQVKASQLALDGVRQEALVGTRTTLDVLNAQRDLTNAEIQRINAEAEEVVAAYRLMQTTGQLTPAAIGLPVPDYDPAENYKSVRYKIIGTGVNSAE